MCLTSFTRRFVAGLIAFFLAVVAFASPPAVSRKTNAVGSSAFIENAGQWDSRAQFLSRTGGLNLWITEEGPVFEFNKFVPTGVVRTSVRNPKKQQVKGYVKGQVVKLSFVNANSSATSGQNEQKSKFSYFLGNDKSKWVSGAKSYGAVTAERLYSGVSVNYSIDQGTPRYDVIVKPGADASQVGIRIEGADDARVLPNGNLALKTSLGEVEERGLTAYQETGIGRVQVPCRMTMEGNTMHFDTGSYDTAKPLIIDPLIASTFLGGSSNQGISGCALDSANNIYVTGNTTSAYFPTSVGAYQTDATSPGYISKLHPTESTLVYSATFGGSASNQSIAISVDSSGNAFVGGQTTSSDFPTTTGAFATTNPAPDSYAGFVTELNPSGTSLVYSTFLGCSTGGTTVAAIAVDSSDESVVTGYTYGANFPVSPTAFQTTNFELNGGTGFVTKFDSSGSALAYSTYLGGSGNAGLGEVVNGVVLDGSGNAVVCGQTASTNFPVTAGSYQRVNNLQESDQYTGFVTKLNSAGTSLIFSTYLGGAGILTMDRGIFRMLLPLIPRAMSPLWGKPTQPIFLSVLAPT